MYPSYRSCPDLWCITAYFNPAHYRTRRANYELFAVPICAAGIPLLTVECAFGDDPFELPPGPDVLQMRAPDVLWQKERLINLGAAHLPPEVIKVAWLDGDILFTNRDWAVETAALLDDYPVVQPFAWAVRLEQGEHTADARAKRHESFASVWQRDRGLIHMGGLDVHGHTGFAWAAQRDLLTRHGLYEAFVTSNGDHFLAHAFAGDFVSQCLQSVRQGSRLAPFSRRVHRTSFGAFLHSLAPPRMRHRIHNLPGIRQPNAAFWTHFTTWGEPVAKLIGGRIGCTSGTVLHLWHGEITNRQAGAGRQFLHAHGFDPTKDLRIGTTGCLEWASDKPQLHAWLLRFFRERREDGS
jgi:hypothetical protein